MKCGYYKERIITKNVLNYVSRKRRNEYILISRNILVIVINVIKLEFII